MNYRVDGRCFDSGKFAFAYAQKRAAEVRFSVTIEQSEDGKHWKPLKEVEPEYRTAVDGEARKARRAREAKARASQLDAFDAMTRREY